MITLELVVEAAADEDDKNVDCNDDEEDRDNEPIKAPQLSTLESACFNFSSHCMTVI